MGGCHHNLRRDRKGKGATKTGEGRVRKGRGREKGTVHSDRLLPIQFIKYGHIPKLGHLFSRLQLQHPPSFPCHSQYADVIIS